jgi:hypothetical protein
MMLDGSGYPSLYSLLARLLALSFGQSLLQRFQNDRRGPQPNCFRPFFYRLYSIHDTLSLALEKCVLSFIVWSLFVG